MARFERSFPGLVRLLCCVAAPLLPALLAGNHAYADVPDTTPIVLEPLTVIGSKSEQPVGEVPATVSVIDSDRIAATLSEDLKALLRYEPGVSVSSDPNRFGIGGVNIRGMGGNRVGMEIDGVPIPKAFAVGSFSDAGRDFVDLNLVKRVEILRGPASTLYGSDALGGVMTFTTKDPWDFATVGQGPYLGLKTSYDGSDSSLQGSVTTAFDRNRIAGVISFSHRGGHETKNNGTSPTAAPNPADYDKQNVFIKLVHGGDSNRPLKLVLDRQETDRFTEVHSFLGLPGRFATTTRLEGDDSSSRARISLEQTFETERQFADAAMWRLYHQRSETSQDTLQERSASARAPSPTRRERMFLYEQKSLGLESTLEKSFGRHWLVYGVEAVHTRATEERDGMETNLDDGSTTDVILGEEFPVRDFPISDTLEVGAYVQDEIRLGRLSLIPGLRFEYHDLSPQSDAIYSEDNPGFATASLRESNLSPKFGVRFSVNERLTLLAQYSQGFRSPPLEDVNIGLTIPLFGYVALPNPDLKPETSQGLELGFRWQSDFLTMNLVGYYNRYEDLIESRVNLGVDPETGFLIFQSLNRDRAEIAGLEHRLSMRFGQRRPGLQGLTFDAALSVARGRDEARDEPLNSIDPPSLVLGLAFDAPNTRWGVELLTRLVAKKTRVDESAGPLFQPPEHGIVDLLGHYEINEHLTLRAGLFNVGDKTYWDWSDVGGLPEDDPLIDSYIRPGRYASLSLDYRR